MSSKKYIFVLVLVLSISYSFAQNHIDALRYSQQFYSTTAKSDAMGNSLSALGADMSAFSINPAGIAVFKSAQFTFTPNFIIIIHKEAMPAVHVRKINTVLPFLILLMSVLYL